MKIKPLSDHILIKPSEKEEETKSGIVIPETSEKEEPQRGKVVAVGPGKKLSSGKTVPLEVQEGQTVLFRKYGPDQIKVEDEEYLIAKEEDVLAILE